MNVNLAGSQRLLQKGLSKDRFLLDERGEAAALLRMVEGRLEAMTASDVEVASELSARLFAAGGKRIRPTLVILSALASGGSDDHTRIIDLAAAAELIHTASLVHDDVVDEAAERRGVATANARWGNKLSVLGGDFLLSKAFCLIAGVREPEILRALSHTAVRMSEAEMLQAMCEGSLALWEASYHRIVEGKTAGFMAVCCECGAILAGAGDPARAALADYGRNLGMAFQITDDLLDIVGDPSVTGKDIGTDLMHGKFTLPLLIAVQNLDVAERCRGLLSEGTELTPENARAIAKLIVESGAADEARRAALGYAHKASARLEELPPSSHVDTLRALAMSLVSREG